VKRDASFDEVSLDALSTLPAYQPISEGRSGFRSAGMNDGIGIQQ
jgi:hypothetical protein